MKLDQVRKVAKLAQIKLDEDEEKKILQELETILKYMDILQEQKHSTQLIAQDGSPSTIEREDRVLDKADIAQSILKQAPKEIANSFGVPKIIDG